MLPPPTIPTRSAGPIVNTENQQRQRHQNPAASSSSSSSLFSHDGASGSSYPGISTSTSNRTATGPSSLRSFVFTDRAYVRHGVFAGRHMRFHLEVAQEPIHGRRKTEKDRRPLAHCPIVRLRIKECRRITDASLEWRGRGDGEEGWEETELDMAAIETSNFICAAELNEASTTSPAQTPAHTSQTRTHETLSARGKDGSSSSIAPMANIHFPHRPPPAPLSTYPSRSVDGDVTMGYGDRSSPEPEAGPSSSRRIQHFQGPSGATSSPDVLRHVRDAPGPMPTEISHETQESNDARRAKAWGRNLYGNAHVSGIRVPAPEGGLGMWFLFTDLSVRQEGSYNLQFRCFDITAVPDDSPYPSPPLVATSSQDFKVYSPRNFPGIPKPTELAEHFNRLGFKLNTRKNERVTDFSPGTTPVRRPSPQPVQHHDEHASPSSSTRPASSSTAGRQPPSQANTTSSSGTGSGTVTDHSSTGESVPLSGGSGGMPGMPGGLPDMSRRGSR